MYFILHATLRLNDRTVGKLAAPVRLKLCCLPGEILSLLTCHSYSRLKIEEVEDKEAQSKAQAHTGAKKSKRKILNRSSANAPPQTSLPVITKYGRREVELSCAGAVQRETWIKF